MKYQKMVILKDHVSYYKIVWEIDYYSLHQSQVSFIFEWINIVLQFAKLISTNGDHQESYVIKLNVSIEKDLLEKSQKTEQVKVL